MLMSAVLYIPAFELPVFRHVDSPWLCKVYTSNPKLLPNVVSDSAKDAISPVIT